MKRALSFLLGVALAAPIASPQDRPRTLGEVPRIYTGTCAGTLSGTGTACTIQQLASGSNKVRLIAAQVYCSVVCSATPERNGTAATTTAVTTKAINPDKPDASVAVVYSSSDVGVGTTLTPAQPLPVGLSQIDLNGQYLIGDGTTKNATVRLATMTGTYFIIWKYEEYN